MYKMTWEKWFISLGIFFLASCPFIGFLIIFPFWADYSIKKKGDIFGIDPSAYPQYFMGGMLIQFLLLAVAFAVVEANTGNMAGLLFLNNCEKLTPLCLGGIFLLPTLIRGRCPVDVMMKMKKE